ncbi:MAG: hypothetical protein Q8O64_10230 [Sideroxyarcus sp.]|nr:hypothetical protein [Sideroxyarcus sp.]
MKQVHFKRRIDEICTGKRAVTAMRLGRLFGMSAQTWMNLQTQYDLEIAENELGDKNRPRGYAAIGITRNVGVSISEAHCTGCDRIGFQFMHLCIPHFIRRNNDCALRGLNPNTSHAPQVASIGELHIAHDEDCRVYWLARKMIVSIEYGPIDLF